MHEIKEIYPKLCLSYVNWVHDGATKMLLGWGDKKEVVRLNHMASIGFVKSSSQIRSLRAMSLR